MTRAQQTKRREKKEKKGKDRESEEKENNTKNISNENRTYSKDSMTLLQSNARRESEWERGKKEGSWEVVVFSSN